MVVLRNLVVHYLSRSQKCNRYSKPRPPRRHRLRNTACLLIHDAHFFLNSALSNIRTIGVANLLTMT